MAKTYKISMKYYKSECDKLIQYNPETKVFKIRNTIERIDTRVSETDFNEMNCVEIKKSEFSRLMNIFFKNVDHKWVFDHSHFKKLGNFEEENGCCPTNYLLGKKGVPYHVIEGKEYLGDLLLVYHWGKVYYHTISYNGYEQGQLVCTKTFKLVRWAKLKHCAPIQNKNSKRIC